MRHVYSAGIVIYRMKNNNPEYLLLHYPSGHWEFPKGKLEPGETREQAAIRELKEETNLDVTLKKDFSESLSYQFRGSGGGLMLKTVFFFIGEVVGSDDVILSHEHQGFEWLTYEDALYRLTFENAKQILQKAHDALIHPNN